MNLGSSESGVFADIYFKNPLTGWVISNNGDILQSTNAGNTWNIENVSPKGNLTSIDFVDLNSGWLLADESINGAITSNVWKTTNRGYNWYKINTCSNCEYKGLDFVDQNTGFICGKEGKILRTTDGGNSFSVFIQGIAELKSIFFLNSNTGFVSGTSGLALKTVNSGLNWNSLQTNSSRNLNKIFFSDTLIGYIACDSGYILKTTNKGENWHSQYTGDAQTYFSLFFVNNNTGYASGSRYTSISPPQIRTSLVKTTNGGVNWSTTLSESVFPTAAYNDVYFINDQTGWLAVQKSHIGYVYKTTNGGQNWFTVFGPFGTSLQHGGLNKILCPSPGNLITCGQRGVIFSTLSPLNVQSTSTLFNENYLLSQNYPNPFNPQTKIKFDVPRNVKGQISNVKLVIYDLLGREVATLVNEELKPGTYEADWDGSGYSSGVYFYKLVVGDPSTTPEAVNSSGRGFVETKKMVLMK